MSVLEAETSINFPINVETIGDCAAANPQEVKQMTPDAKMATYLSIPKQVPASTKGKTETSYQSGGWKPTVS